jgi:hypothetical protein
MQLLQIRSRIGCQCAMHEPLPSPISERIGHDDMLFGGAGEGEEGAQNWVLRVRRNWKSWFCDVFVLINDLDECHQYSVIQYSWYYQRGA